MPTPDQIKDRVTTIVTRDHAPEARQLVRTAIRVAAWLMVCALVLLTLVPPAVRPVSPAPTELEHFVSFAVAGTLQYMSYRGRPLLWVVVATAFTGAMELLQIFLPGRHARFSDFVIDAFAAYIGILIGLLICRSRIAP